MKNVSEGCKYGKYIVAFFSLFITTNILHLPVPAATSVKAAGSLLLPSWAASTLAACCCYLRLHTVSSGPTTVSCYYCRYPPP